MLDEHWGTVTGTEHELGVMNSKGSEIFDSAKLPSDEFVSNGARVYEDMGHPEMSTAEASNPFQLAAIERALSLRMLELGLKVNLYKNTTDYRGGLSSNHSFAAHENYFTCANRGDLEILIPFIVSRIIFTGSGDTAHGDNDLWLSQRAPFINTLISSDTISNRGLLNTRNEPLSNVPGWYRLHHIPNDANMCPGAIILKHGTMMLLLKLLEDDELEPLPYDLSKAVSDYHEINKHTKDWVLKGTKPNPMRAVDVQGFYLNQVASKIKNPSPLQKITIDLWAETLKALEADPLATAGVVDWATKVIIFNWYTEDQSGQEIPLKTRQSLDLEYHNIDPKHGIHYAFEDYVNVPLILPEDEVKRLINSPPTTTRAWFRGEAVRLGEEASRKGSELRVDADWSSVNLYSGGTYLEELSFKLDDPRENYADRIVKLRTKLGLD